MKREMKIVTLWLMTICGLCCHTLTDLLPIFWGKNLAVMATDGNVQWGMIVMMMTITFVIPVIGLFCLMSDCKTKMAKWVNVVLAVLMALFNVAHACMELPSENAAQYVIMPLMAVIGIVLAWQSVKYLKEN